ncbi:MAG TPA: bifunctional UDP-N-acetylmuramoyl-tripeptide:D-alanyl-D-alanine ligase/alanine racemase [Puia sp.]|nr:bifunctional UDP-N-acetylmuramoyl-tripeptide:D-alanyl-D-alanine ligase/alanine racemase [Puia sp.]
MKYTIENINKIIQGSLLQAVHEQPVEYLVTDSRKLIFPDTSIFFSLQGARRDGHQFVQELYDRGVRNFVVNKKSVALSCPDANIILVKDSLVALQSLVAFHRQQFAIPVIGISGSNGKTIVKEWLNQLLEDQYNIVRSPKSYNSQIGVPLSVWQMNDANELGIFEAGISQPGEMEKLEAIIRPSLGIFTNIGEAHSEGFKSTGKKIREKLQLFNRAEVLIYSPDYPEMEGVVTAWAKNKEVELFSWGKAKNATVRLRSIKRAGGNTAVKLSYEKKQLLINIPFRDHASVENAMNCVCTLLYLQTDIESIQKKLYKLTPVAMRLELQSGINNCAIINDSYSADTSSLKIALDFLSQQQQHTRRTVILSDILQSGKGDKKLYREIAQMLHQKKINRLLAIGESVSANQEIFRQVFPGEAYFFSSTEAFIQAFPQTVFKDETILIKGARSFQFEKIDHLLAQQAHQTVLEIDLNAMAHNLKQYQQLLHPATRLMAMVKAFAYGAGSYEVANLLQFHKIDYLAVAYADEAVELRKAGIRLPIMVMNTEENSLDALVQYDLEPVIYSFRLLHAVDQYLKKEGIPQIPVHIEIETGMNRLGFAMEDLPALLGSLEKTSFKIQSVFSHLAASEEKQQDEFTLRQAALFLEAAGQIQQACKYPFLRHLANSAAILRLPELRMDMVRLGIGLYGIDPTLSHQLDLLEVATLKSTIAQIKFLKKGETVGYNRKGVALDGMTIATVRIGYADGYPRSLGIGAGKMLVRGRLAPTTGSICMDMTMIDITGIPDVKEGDEVIVFGKELSVQQVAHWAQTIPYEMMTGISQRVKRIYFEE